MPSAREFASYSVGFSVAVALLLYVIFGVFGGWVDQQIYDSCIRRNPEASVCVPPQEAERYYRGY